MSDRAHLIIFDSPIGFCGFVHIDQVLQTLRVGFESRQSCRQAFETFEGDLHCPEQPNAWESNFADRLVSSLHSDHDRDDDFSDIEIADGHLTDFQKAVSDACRQIGFGKTVSYGELAQKVGHPGAARAVGSVMSRNRFLLIVPCHRVLGSNGLGGYAAPSGTGTKKQLLEIEGHIWPSPRKTETQTALF